MTKRHVMGIDGMAMDDAFLDERRGETQRAFAKEVENYATYNPDWSRILSLLSNRNDDMYEAVIRELISKRVLTKLENDSYVLMARDRMLDITPLANLGFSRKEEAERFAKANGIGEVRKYSEVKDSKRLPVYSTY